MRKETRRLNPVGFFFQGRPPTEAALPHKNNREPERDQQQTGRRVDHGEKWVPAVVHVGQRPHC
jgi:hypothetical protein